MVDPPALEQLPDISKLGIARAIADGVESGFGGRQVLLEVLALALGIAQAHARALAVHDDPLAGAIRADARMREHFFTHDRFAGESRITSVRRPDLR